MNKYNHWIGKLFSKFNGGVNYAVTFGQTTYFSCDESIVPVWWHRHEDKHKEQYAKDGWIKFLSWYILQLLIKGYLNIDYEIEARQAAIPYGGPVIKSNNNPIGMILLGIFSAFIALIILGIKYGK